ncbi:MULTISPECIES: hypothetical protein [Nocardia]|uniref:Uncharacterized protein n=1 Tax=Nocardia elegans TaxID=300029 RepID=A0ABW6TRW0_9NOCA|nr:MULTISPECIES: hypothetical protein [Nocardia]
MVGKLQKLDFLERNPDYLADLIISRWQAGERPAEQLLDARATCHKDS